MTPSYRFTLETLDDRGNRLEQTPVEPAWQAAIECASFEAARRARRPPVSAPAQGEVLPIWDRELGEPHVGAFRVAVRLDHGATYSREIPLTYVAGQALQVADRLADRGAVEKGARLRYRVCAFADSQAPPASHLIDLEEIADPLPVSEISFAERLAGAQRHGEIATDDGDPTVLVDGAVVREAVESAVASPDTETGGLLIGHLRGDRYSGDLGVEITAQLPARHTEASATKLTFTADTWAAARAAIALRGCGELLLGWWHHHVAFCRDCPPDRYRQCPLRKEFFSADDMHLQASVFDRAYHVAMLVTLDVERPPSLSFYGWRDGTVQRRGVHVITDVEPN